MGEEERKGERERMVCGGRGVVRQKCMKLRSTSRQKAGMSG
jgi:hypothetical protein